jgi:predicted outer membrane repeat protein
LAFLILCTTGSAAASPPRQAAATITVCPGGCDHATIQGAINAAANGDTIQIFMTSALTEADIIVNKDLTIEGLDQTQTVVQAAATSGTANARVFTILSGSTVTMRTFTIRNGRVTGSNGGGIWVQAGGQLTLNEMRLTLNEALRGGGIANEGTLTLRGGAVNENQAALSGGGLYNEGTFYTWLAPIFQSNTANSGGGIHVEGGSVLLSGAQIIDNENQGMLVSDGSVSLRDTALNYNTAGGIWAGGGTIEGTRLSITANRTPGSCGGGIGVYGDAELILTESSLRNNEALEGAGLCQVSASSAVYLTNVSLIYNEAGHQGGGIYAGSGLMWLANVTLAQNIASLDDPWSYAGGGVYIEDGEVHLRSALIGDNGDDTNYPDCYGVFQTATFSLIGDRGQLEPRCGWLGFSSGMLSDVDPQLGASIIGGYTSGIELQADSPAIDSGLCISATGPAPETDQRGYIVPWDGDSDGDAYCDMGALEYGSEPPNRLYLPLVVKP